MAVGEPCPHCDSNVPLTDEGVLEVEATYTFEVEGATLELDVETVELSVRVLDQWADLLSRTVYVAEAIDCVPVDGDTHFLDDLQARQFLLEEMKEEFPSGVDQLPPPGTVPLRRPIADREIEETQVYLYHNDAGISLAELVVLADGDLDARQVTDIFRAVLDGVEDVHDAGLLHLYLNPEAVRVRLKNTEVGIPLSGEGEAEPSGVQEVIDEPPNAGERRESSEWQAGDYDETKPQTPLNVRIGDIDTEELPPFEEGATSLGEETSEVNEAGMSGENWIRSLLGVEQLVGGSVDEESAAASVGQSISEQIPAERNEVELEAVFDSICGLYPHDDKPRELDIISGFSAPEAYSRGGPSLGSTSDVFSAGMILYYLIAGRIPPASVYTRHAPAIPARNFRPDFPPGLGPVVKRATRPDPEMRYPDISSFGTGYDNAFESIEDRSPEKREAIPAMSASVDRHIGIAKRKRNPVNQDDVFIGTSENGEFGLIVVADGVSTASYGSGDIASGLLIDVAEEVWNEILPVYLMDEPLDEIETVEEILEEANSRIIDYVNERHTPFEGSAHEVMGTTGLVSLYHRGRVTLAAIGDSRGYLQRGPGLEQLTIDHNLWTLSILEGLPADEALSMPRGDALARCLGAFKLDDGTLVPESPGMDIFQFPVSAGDTLLLTTDGLIDFAGGNVANAEENILATLLSEPEPALACLELILLANRGGGGDNIGLGVARFD